MTERLLTTFSQNFHTFLRKLQIGLLKSVMYQISTCVIICLSVSMRQITTFQPLGSLGDSA